MEPLFKQRSILSELTTTMDSETQQQPFRSSTSLPFHLKSRAGRDVIVFAYFPSSPRPWVGAMQQGDEWVAMSWLNNGQYISDSVSADKLVKSHSDVPDLLGKSSMLYEE